MQYKVIVHINGIDYEPDLDIMTGFYLDPLMQDNPVLNFRESSLPEILKLANDCGAQKITLLPVEDENE